MPLGSLLPLASEAKGAVRSHGQLKLSSLASSLPLPPLLSSPNPHAPAHHRHTCGVCDDDLHGWTTSVSLHATAVQGLACAELAVGMQRGGAHRALQAVWEGGEHEGQRRGKSQPGVRRVCKPPLSFLLLGFASSCGMHVRVGPGFPHGLGFWLDGVPWVEVCEGGAEDCLAAFLSRDLPLGCAGRRSLLYGYLGFSTVGFDENHFFF